LATGTGKGKMITCLINICFPMNVLFGLRNNSASSLSKLKAK